MSDTEKAKDSSAGGISGKAADGGATNTVEGETSKEVENRDSGGLSIGAIIGIASGGIALIGIVAFTCTRACRGGKKQESHQALLPAEPSNGSDAAKTHMWNDTALLSVKLNDQEIEDVKQTGEGGYGDVWFVRYRKTQLLASKRLRKGEVDPSKIEKFIKEIKLVAKLDHPRIVTFGGAAWTIKATCRRSSSTWKVATSGTTSKIRKLRDPGSTRSSRSPSMSSKRWCTCIRSRSH